MVAFHSSGRGNLLVPIPLADTAVQKRGGRNRQTDKQTNIYAFPTVVQCWITLRVNQHKNGQNKVSVLVTTSLKAVHDKMFQ